MFADLNARYRRPPGIASSDPGNIITDGSDGALYANVDAGTEFGGGLTNGSTYNMSNEPVQPLYGLLLTTVSAIASLTVNLRDNNPTSPFGTPLLYVVVAGQVTTLTFTGTNLSNAMLPIVTTTVAGGAGFLFAWNTAAASGKWVRIL